MWYKSPSFVSTLFLRVSVGVSLVVLGIAFYRDFAPFHANVIDGLGSIRIIGDIWSYVLPALFIFTGGMLAVGRYAFVTAWTGGIALGSVPVGMTLKILMTNTPVPEVLAFVSPILIWLIVFHLAVTTQVTVEVAEEDDE